MIIISQSLCANVSFWQYFGLEEKQVPLIILQENDGKKFLKPNLEPDQIAAWLGEYVVMPSVF